MSALATDGVSLGTKPRFQSLANDRWPGL